MEHLSYWEKSVLKNQDIVIIGGGLVGLTIAIEARKKFPTRKISIFERSINGAGASTKNAGFACFGSISEIDDDLNSLPESEIVDLISLRYTGLQYLQEYLPNPEVIDLAFHGGYEVFTQDDADSFISFKKRIDFFNELVHKATGLKDCYSTRETHPEFNLFKSCFFNQFEGQLNPVKLINHLHKIAMNADVQIYHGAELLHWEEADGILLEFKDGLKIYTDQLVFATNAFSNTFFEDLDLVPYRNQVLITSEIPDLNIRGTFHFNKGFTYFRNVGNRILLGGFRDIDMDGEQTTEFGTSDTIQDSLVSFLRDRLNIEASIDHRWSGILATGTKKSAIVEERGNGVFMAIRLGGMGVAIGSKVARDLVAILN